MTSSPFSTTRRNSSRKERQKSYEKAAHDVILWHLVKDRRPAYVESPLSAQEWILTVDFRLIGFDKYKLKGSGSNIPLCLSPTSLIQLLQFWVPRTQQFEEAVLGSLRLPFLFQDFDVKAERLSLTIIEQLGRFEGSEEIPQEALVKVVMNKGLRSRLNAGQPEEEERKLVRDALVKEMQSVAQQENSRAEKLESVVKDKDVVLAVLQREAEVKDNKIKELLDSNQAILLSVEDNKDLRKELSRQKSKLAHIDEQRLQHRSRLRYAFFLIIVLGLSSMAAWGIGFVFHERGLIFIQVAVLISVFMILHLLVEVIPRGDQQMKKLLIFEQTSKFRKWLWGLVILLVISVISNLITNWIS